MFQFFQNQAAGTLAEYQAVALGVKGTGGRVGGFVTHTGGEQSIEYRGLGNAQLLGTTGDHRKLVASADRFISVANALAARRAGAGCCYNKPAHTEKYPEIHGRG